MAIPAYPMACFKFPKNVCDSFDSLFGNFWWGATTKGNKIHWRSWDFLSQPKADGGLGFQNLQHFNLAFLAKQVWRLVENPTSLWAEVLKSRYFPDCDFFSAMKGYRASWSWSSLLEARDIILAGCCWQVVNGSSVRVWQDKWLPNPSPRLLPSSIVPRPTALVLVSKLIDWERKVWNLSGILGSISREVAEQIQEMPIGEIDGQDRLIWPHDKSGTYTVRSGYIWIHHHEESTSKPITTASSSYQINKVIWPLLWKIKTIPKVRLFLLQAISGIGASQYNLFRRKLATNSTCQLCGQGDETFEHILLLCPWATSVWFRSLGLRINKQSIIHFGDWFLNTYHSISCVSIREKFLILGSILCWHIWISHCRFLYDGASLSSVSTIAAACVMHSEILAANRRPLAEPPDPGSNLPSLVHWKPPETGFLAINCDAGWRPNLHARLGTVIRDHGCNFVGGAAKSITYLSSDQAEAEAVLLGLDLAIELGHQHVIVESDNKTLIGDIMGYKSSCWTSYLIIERIRNLGRYFLDCRWRWIPRSANNAAHTAASLATEAVDLLRWAAQPPLPLLAALISDGLTATGIG